MTSTISFENAALGPIGFGQPLSVQFSPDGDMITYLYPDSQGNRQVFAYPISLDSSSSSLSSSGDDLSPRELVDTKKLGEGSKNASLSLQEQLRMERQRLAGRGLSSFMWGSLSGVKKGGRIIAPSAGSVLLFEQDSDTLIPVYSSSDFVPTAGSPSHPSYDAVDPQLSPMGDAVAFVVNDDLYYLPLPPHPSAAGTTSTSSPTSSHPIRLTSEGEKKGVSCGLADYLAQEELDRYR